MNFKDLFDNDTERAVSPVIGVILMVAITVILAAVIGTFVLGLGDQVQQTSPNAQWDWEANGDITSSGNLTLTHTSGDSVDASTLNVTGSAVSGGPYSIGPSGTLPTGADGSLFSNDQVTAGDSATIDSAELSGSSGDEVRLVWQSEGGGSSSTLTTYELE